MKPRHVEAAERLAPDAVIFHAFVAQEGSAWQRWIAVIALGGGSAVVASLGATWLVTVLAGLVTGLAAFAIGGPWRVVALTPDQALLFSTRRASLRPTAHRLIDRATRDSVERSASGPVNERWRFGGHSLVVRRDDASSIDRWCPSTG